MVSIFNSCWVAAGRKFGPRFGMPERGCVRIGWNRQKEAELGGLPDRELDFHQCALKSRRTGDRLQEDFAAGTDDFVMVALDPDTDRAERGVAFQIGAGTHES